MKRTIAHLILLGLLFLSGCTTPNKTNQLSEGELRDIAQEFANTITDSKPKLLEEIPEDKNQTQFTFQTLEFKLYISVNNETGSIEGIHRKE
jgi:hypothetical protein